MSPAAQIDKVAVPAVYIDSSVYDVKDWPKQIAFHKSKAKYRLQVGGYGCLAAGTIIADGIPVESWSGGLVGQRFVGPSFLKGVAALYRVSTRSGKQVVVTDAHRFLSPTGWCPLRSLRVGTLIAADGNVHDSSAMGTPEDSRGHCSAEPHRCGGLSHPFQAAFLHKLRQFRRTGVCSSALDLYDLLSTENSLSLDFFLCESFWGIHHESTGVEPPHADSHKEAADTISKLQSVPRRPSSVQQFRREEDDEVSFPDLCFASSPRSVLYQRNSDSLIGPVEVFRGSQQNTGAAYEDEASLCVPRKSDDLSLLVPPDYVHSFWDEIVEILYIGQGDFYDLTVPGFEHYSAHGLWHHNSGKSRPLLWEAIFHALEYPGSNSLLLRKTIPDLKRTVIDKFLSDVPKHLYQFYNQTDHIVYFHPHPVTKKQSKLYLSACERDEDVGKFLSTEYVYIGFEELGEFSFAVWDALKDRNRCTIPGSRSCMAGATNPTGVGWGWIRKLWIQKKPFVGMDPTKYDPNDYEYIHSTVDDNPIFSKDEEYIKSLESGPARDIRRWGKMDGVTGNYFDNWDETRHKRALGKFIFEKWQPIWIGWDYGFAHYACMVFMTKAITKNLLGFPKMVNVVLGEIVLQENTPKEQAEAVLLAIPEADRPRVDSVHLSWERFMRTTSNFTVADEIGEILSAGGLPKPTPSNKDRVAGWMKCYSLLDTDDLYLIEDTCPLSLPSTAPAVLAEAIPALNRNPKNLEDVLKPPGISLQDDIGEAWRYAIAGTLLDEEDKPADVKFKEKLAAIPDPLARHMEAMRNYFEENKKASQVGMKYIPTWQKNLK